MQTGIYELNNKMNESDFLEEIKRIDEDLGKMGLCSDWCDAGGPEPRRLRVRFHSAEHDSVVCQLTTV